MGLDILRPFPLAPRQFKYLVVVIDYFTKLIEAKPLPAITMEKVRKFIWNRIICRYGISHRQLLSDNRTQFTDWKVEDFYKELAIT